MLGAVVNHVGHVSGDRGEAVLSGFEQLHSVWHRPQITQAQGAPVLDGFPGEEVLATAAGVTHGLFLKGDAARGMAGATMAQALHQIGAAIDQRIAVRVGFERLIIDKCPVPECQPPAHVERPAHVGGLVGLADRLHRLHQVGVQRLHVLLADFGVGRVGHGGIQMGAVGAHPFAHGLVELLEAVTPDTGFRVRGDIA
ncbi:hypothetical protein D3C75_880460 [compost metagenome]